MNRLFFALLFLPCLVGAQSDPLSYVNPFIGTGGHGHTYPGATAPFGMVQLSPDTRLDGWDGCSAYHYDDSILYGFSHTHLSGTGVSDYGDLLLMPALKGPDTTSDYPYKAIFSHADEVAEPGWYQVQLKNNITVSLTATTFSGFHRYAYPASDTQWVVLRFDHRDRTISAVLKATGKRTLVGHRHSKAWAENQKLFFYLEFDADVALFDAQGQPFQGGDPGKEIWFRLIGRQKVEVKMSLSGVDEAGAMLNHGQTAFKFGAALANTQQDWRKELGKIKVEGDITQLRKFYTALYHTQIVPNRFSDADGWYRGLDGKLYEGRSHTQYTVFSLWDTYRAAHPLYTLIDEARTQDYLQSFLKMYEQAGHLPVWELAGNETWCMIGYHSASVIADAVLKGLVDTTLARKLLVAMTKTADANRYGLEIYRQKGYLEITDEPESVSKTLEYAYNDWCVSVVANWLGETEIARTYSYRSRSWVNMLDPESGLMRPRANGGFVTPFDPKEVNSHFTEANSWQYSFYVPHDIVGYKGMLGEARMKRLLDSLFRENPNTTGRNQADITGLIGQYAHGNEPSHHMAYLYHNLGLPHSSQELVDAILDTLYHDAPDGLSGNEDCGQMSAWLVMSSLGIYSIAPGNPNYALLAPAFPEAVLQLETGKTFSFRKKGIGSYVQTVSLNGRNWPNNYLPHDSIRQGGVIAFVMGPKPSTWGRAPNERWTSSSTQLLLPAPVISAKTMSFYDSLVVQWSVLPGMQIRYTLDGSDPAQGIVAKTNQLILKETTRIRMVQLLPTADADNYAFKSDESEAVFNRLPRRIKLSWSPAPKAEYQAGGPLTLVDGLFGDTEWRKGRWVGWEGKDVELLLDFGSPQEIKAVYGSFVQDSKPWIVFPKAMEVYGSSDGKSYQLLFSSTEKVDALNEAVQIHQLGQKLAAPVQLRYLKIKIVHYGQLPRQHLGHPNAAYIFMDEVVVQ